MKSFNILIILMLHTLCSVSQDAHADLAGKFLASLSAEQRAKAFYAFDSDERYTWNFVPKQDRKGIWLKDLTEAQKKTGFELLKYWVSKKGYEQIEGIMSLEDVLKVIEKRDSDWPRSQVNYAFTFFGEPSADKPWGWRFEGHHVSFNFSSYRNRIQSGLPSFLGTNPGKFERFGKTVEILKEESVVGFKLLGSLNAEQLKKAVFMDTAYDNVAIWNSRKALEYEPKGIFYKELDKDQQKIFLELLNIYLSRYPPEYAKDMMNEIEKAGIGELRFAWGGYTKQTPSRVYYYRIKGPTILIELENALNDANHVHTIMRDLLHDFGGDQLMEHWKQGH
ncbi:MAG TPA: DUF3500 domain-containing protein [Chitinophagaceae bacterium]|nr:DUF3500 domain-containing protein [Chitinophagaceae bacterium]